MGGKGRRRREKNYRVAHGGGGHSRLPPPPTSSSLDAMPSKLRQLMSFTNSGSAKVSVNTEQRNRGGGSSSNSNSNGVDKKRSSEVRVDSKTTGIRREVEGNLSPQDTDHGHEIVDDSERVKRKRKKKRKRVDDLRFQTEEELGGVGSRRREHKKKRLEAMKKKNKKVKAEDDLDFPGQEKIRFGDIVKAPPKLVTVPKAPKTPQDASLERLRLQAIEDYRNRKGWASRPGVHLPPPVITTPSL